MAFCPNCGTPNTDQAEKCAACGFELAAPSQKPKFKGTIMMAGIKAPLVPPSAGAPEPPPPSYAPPARPAALSQPAASPAPEASRNLPHEKTMLGRPAVNFPAPSPASPPRSVPALANTAVQRPGMPYAPAPQPSPPAEPPLGSQQPTPPPSPFAQHSTQPSAPGFAPQPQGFPQGGFASPSPHAPAPQAPSGQGHEPFAATQASTPFAPAAPPPQFTQPGGSSFTPGGESSATPSYRDDASLYGARSAGQTRDDSSASAYAGPSSGTYAPSITGNPGESTYPPPPGTSTNTGRLLGIGCAAVLALSLLVAGLLYISFGDKLKVLFGGGADSEEASAWQASMAQALAQVAGLCSADCKRASVFFHPDAVDELLAEARSLTPERVQKLSDPSQSEAEMLSETDDDSIAEQLGLDPEQCARITLNEAKVVSCSVPDPSGKPGVLRIVHLSGLAAL